MSDFVPISVWYGENRARAPMLPTSTEETRERAATDIATIAEQGFNAIRFWVDWASIEPTRGEYAVEGLDHLMDAAHENGLRVICQLYVESAPSWVHQEYPEARYTAQSGDRIDPQTSPGVSLDHPEVREHAGAMIEKIAGHVGDHPAFHAWDVWSEPHLIQWTWLEWLPFSIAWFDYSPASKRRFREWLQDQYDGIEALNETWYRTYQDWEAVEPPKYVTLSTYADLIDWQEYTLEKITEDLAWRRERVRAVDEDSIVASHAAITSVFSLPLNWYGNPDDWRVAEEVDVWGTSMYPKHTGPSMPLGPAVRGTALDATRSSAHHNDTEFWVGELQGGHGNTGMRFGEPVTAEDVALWGWSALSRGAKGLHYYAWYPMSCGYETSGFGLAEFDGSVNDRVRSAGDLAGTVTREMDLFAESQPVDPAVGVVYDIHATEMLLATREPARDDGEPGMLNLSFKGLYRALFEENVPVDFVHGRRVAADDLDQYDALYVPMPIMMPEGMADGIEEYVREGGTLYASLRPAWNDIDNTLAEKIPGHGLHEVFGCEERVIREREEPTVTITDDHDALGAGHDVLGTGHDALGSISVGDTLTGANYEESFEVGDGTVLGEYDDGLAAIVANQYGEGHAVLAGSLLGKAYEESGGDFAGTGRLLRAVAGSAGIEAPVSVEGVGADRQVEARLCSAGDSYLLFAFDHDGESAPSFRVRVGDGYTARDLIAERSLRCEPADGDLVVSTDEATNMWVVELAPG